jgi:hypothetical protein
MRPVDLEPDGGGRGPGMAQGGGDVVEAAGASGVGGDARAALAADA